MQTYAQQTENPNLATFRRLMTLLNVTQDADSLTYKLPNAKLAESCIARAQKIIDQNDLPLEIQQKMGRFLIVKELAA